MLRSKLFVPGSRPDQMAKAAASEADCLSIDLEDAVAASEKDRARREVRRFIEESGCTKTIIVRVNDLSSDLFFDDVAEVVCRGVGMINLPKVEHVRDIATCERFLAHVERRNGLDHEIPIMPTIETPAGIARVRKIAASSPRIRYLQLGFGDLFAPHRIRYTAATTDHARAAVKYAAAEAGIAALDSAFVYVSDSAGLEADAARAREWGFSGKSCIHPSQIATVNRIFSPTEAEVAEAREIVAAYEERAARGDGAFLREGQLIDLPFYEEARRMIAEAGGSR
jgi:citrate lyase subunit beta/citryl-CoA lyase